MGFQKMSSFGWGKGGQVPFPLRDKGHVGIKDFITRLS